MSDFNSQIELLQWLIDGNKAEYKGSKYYAKNGELYLSTFKGLEEKLYGLFTSFPYWYEFKKVVNWYEGINRDDKSTWKLCKVWDDNKQELYFDLICHINTREEKLFIGHWSTWKNARPLTEEEFKNPVLLCKDNEDE